MLMRCSIANLSVCLMHIVSMMDVYAVDCGQGLLVGEGVDGVFAGGFQGWVECAEERSDESYEGGLPDVGDVDDEVERGEAVFECSAEREAGCNAQDDADGREDAGFAEDDADDVRARGSHRFEDADLAGALHDGGVHRLEDDQEADDDGNADDDLKADVEAGEAVGRDGGEILLGGGDVVGAHAGGGEDVLADLVLVLRLVFGAEVEHGGLALGAGERAHGVDGDELAAAFAVSDDAGDSELVVEDADMVADFFAGGGVVVEEDIVGTLEGGAGEEGEGQERVEALEVDAVDGVEGAIDLDVDGGRDDDVGDFREDFCNLDGGSGRAHADEVAGGVGADEHVHADAVLAGLEAVELAHQDGGDGEDHDDLYGDGETADERAEGTVDQIAG